MQEASLSLSLLVEHVGETALSAVLAIVVRSHEDTSTTLSLGALSPEAGDLSVVIHLVVLEDGELHPLLLVPQSLGLGVNLLLSLLTTTTETKHEVEGGLLLDVIVRKGASILELLASEDETLLVGGDSLMYVLFFDAKKILCVEK